MINLGPPQRTVSSVRTRSPGVRESTQARDAVVVAANPDYALLLLEGIGMGCMLVTGFDLLRGNSFGGCANVVYTKCESLKLWFALRIVRFSNRLLDSQKDAAKAQK